MPPTTMTADAAHLWAAATLRETVRCQCCRDMFRRSAMSVYNGICNSCFDKHYTICSLCARPLNCDGGSPYLSPRSYGHISGDVWATRGQPCCYECYNATRRSDHWRPTPMTTSIATYGEVGSTRKYGVEIETSRCPGAEELKGNTLFGAKYDPTVNGLEFDSPILYGDEGFGEIVDILSFADDHDWDVDQSCGCHTHYDMRDESDDQLWATYYAYNVTYLMWAAAVPGWRREVSYCDGPYVCCDDISRMVDDGQTFSGYAYDAERYEYVNAVAYYDHRTFEVRLLEGTIDPGTICNWIALHARFIDRVRNMSFHDCTDFGHTRNRQFAKLVEVIDDAPLTDWLADRARQMGSPLRGPGSAQPF